MSIMHKIRFYHACLAALSLLAYVTGEVGIIHVWLGYGVAGVLALRLLWAFSGNPHVGLMRFYPSFDGLNLANAFTHPAITKVFMLGIALCLLAATATGVAMDKGKGIGLAMNESQGMSLGINESQGMSLGRANLISTAYADDDDDKGEHEGNGAREESFYDEALEETHEFFANLLLLFVGMHVSYLFLFKRPLARYMLYLK